MFALLITACAQEQKQVDSKGQPQEQESDGVKPLPCRVDTPEYTPAPADEISTKGAPALTEADFPEKVIIPVVFHVFGSMQGSGMINVERLEKVIQWINNDFHGIENPSDPRWNGNIMPEFDNVKATFPEIEFRLAQFDPNGNPHEGLCLHTSQEGLAGGKGKGLGDGRGESYVKLYAWDNRMYMNVYITRALYGVNSTDSGVAWPPSMSMTNNGTARVVYNGTFLPGGYFGDVDFTSVISHEFGHFFNLKHTFDGGCSMANAGNPNTGDFCLDTPQADNSNLGKNTRNCEGVLANYDNYMNYGEYGNWTKDQIKRMKLAILNEPSRNCLWTPENLKNTLGIGGTPDPKPDPDPEVPVVKDPATFGEKLNHLNKTAK